MDTPIIVEDQRGHGWTPIDHALLDTYGAQIGPYGLAIYLALARHINTRTQTCYPSYERLAQLTGMSRPQAMRAVKKLIEVGLIAKQTRSNAKKDATANQANVFILLPLQAAPAVRRTVDSGPAYNAQPRESLPDTPPEYPTDTPGVSVSNSRSIPQIPKQESINKKQENKRAAAPASVQPEPSAPPVIPPGTPVNKRPDAPPVLRAVPKPEKLSVQLARWQPDAECQAWWDEQCREEAIPPGAVDVPLETKKWREAESTQGLKPGQFARYWRMWMLRAIERWREKPAPATKAPPTVTGQPYRVVSTARGVAS